jgi:hypothetical protein
VRPAFVFAVPQQLLLKRNYSRIRINKTHSYLLLMPFSYNTVESNRKLEMAEESDVERTEPASARRLEQAREEGQVPRSREVGAFSS